jgi:hypothetical protein
MKKCPKRTKLSINQPTDHDVFHDVFVYQSRLGRVTFHDMGFTICLGTGMFHDMFVC